jgi:hypothetical protein
MLIFHIRFLNIFTDTLIHSGDMGRMWYEDGKYLKKRNTFTDFIACAEHLIKVGSQVLFWRTLNGLFLHIFTEPSQPKPLVTATVRSCWFTGSTVK